MTRPHVVVDPAVRFGCPHIHGAGVPTEVVAEAVMAGDDVDVVADDYGLSRHEAILACWYEATWGRYRKQWKTWAQTVSPALGGHRPLDPEALPEPPSRTDTSPTTKETT